MINLVIDKNCRNQKSIAYTFYYLLKDVGEEISISYLPKNDAVNIMYGVNITENNCIYIPQFSRSEIENLFSMQEKDSDFLINYFNSDPFVIKGDKIIFKSDLIASCFFLISCGEEYIIKNRDSLSRFQAYNSFRREKINVPFFDLGAKVFLDAIKNIKPDVKIKEKQFEILLTHDVDNVNSRNKYVILHDVKELFLDRKKPFNLRFKTLFSHLWSNKYMQIENCVNMEKKREAKSEFYLLQGKKHRYGKRYKLSRIKSQLKILKSNPNFIIGLHTNFFSYDDERKIKLEIEEIEKYANVKVSSCRNHYLRFKTPDTWEKLLNSGILVDTTLGFSDKNGFRAGTTKGFVPYNINNDSVISIYEVPLIIMDCTLMECDKTFEEKWEDAKEIIDNVIRYNGTSSLLWHESVLEQRDYRMMYEKILDYLVENKCSFILSTELKERIENEKSGIEQLMKNLKE